MQRERGVDHGADMHPLNTIKDRLAWLDKEAYGR
jgi:hypothetical protein